MLKSKLLHLSKLSIDIDKIIAVKWETTSGTYITIATLNAEQQSNFHLNPSNPFYQEDVAKLKEALGKDH